MKRVIKLLFILLLQSGGAAFSSTNLLDAKPNQKRQFAQVIARKIAEDITSVEIEQDCVCKQLHAYERSHCKIVGRKEKEQLAVSVYTSNHNYGNNQLRTIVINANMICKFNRNNIFDKNDMTYFMLLCCRDTRKEE